MDWNIGWIFLGGAAYLFLIINLCRTVNGKSKGCEVLIFCSLSFGILTVLNQYRMINHWLAWEEMNSISKMVPAITKSLTLAVWIGVVLNFLIMIVNLNKH